jgi:osmotically-inducible protein OsmY
VSESLAQDSDLDASEIEVKVHNGVVTLTGMVSDRQFKRMAEDLAERCSGVKDVRNEIRTGRESDTTEKGKSTSSATARNH